MPRALPHAPHVSRSVRGGPTRRARSRRGRGAGVPAPSRRRRACALRLPALRRCARGDPGGSAAAGVSRRVSGRASASPGSIRRPRPTRARSRRCTSVSFPSTSFAQATVSFDLSSVSRSASLARAPTTIPARARRRCRPSPRAASRHARRQPMLVEQPLQPPPRRFARRLHARATVGYNPPRDKGRGERSGRGLAHAW